MLRSLGILSGIGENVNAIDSSLKLYYVLIAPGYPLYTKEVYKNNKIYGGDLAKIDNMIKGFNQNDVKLVIDNMFNDLTESAISLNNSRPKVNDIIDKANAYIKSKGCLGKALMSGSGSSVFCALANKKDAKDIYHYLNKYLLDNNYTNAKIILTNN